MESVIPADCRLRNPGIECAYIASEEILVAAGYEEFKGWGPAQPRVSYEREMWAILQALDRTGVPYLAVRNGDTAIFEHARKEGVGVYVQIPGHALVVVRLTDRYAYVINNYTAGPRTPLEVVESKSKQIERWTRQHFLQLWEGVAYCPLHRKRPKSPPVQPPAVVVQPGPLNPTPPVNPMPAPAEKPKEPEAGCKCKPVDLGPVNDALVKLTDIAATTNKSVTAIDARLSTVEGKLAEQAKLPPPSTVAPEQLKAVQDELARLKQSLRQSGTLRISVTPK